LAGETIPAVPLDLFYGKIGVADRGEFEATFGFRDGDVIEPDDGTLRDWRAEFTPAAARRVKFRTTIAAQGTHPLDHVAVPEAKCRLITSNANFTVEEI